MKVVERNGGDDAANDAFNQLAKKLGQQPRTLETTSGKVRVIDLPRGGTAGVRGFSSGSSGNRPSIQFDRPTGPVIKVRF